MSESSATIDVRDMLCAQALAETDRAMKRLAAGETLIVICNAPDVRDDLAAWALSAHHTLATDARGEDIWMWIRKGG